MRKYSVHLINQVRVLRSQGKTFKEINNYLNLRITKSTLSGWCKQVELPKNYLEKITKLNWANLKKARKLSMKAKQLRRKEYLKKLKMVNLPISLNIKDKNTAKIALAMLCLGEASKYNPKTTNSFYFGNSDPKIVKIFLGLLKNCFNFDLEKIRCTVQCRADQDLVFLEEFWANQTKIPKRLFYKTRIDPRTIGKPTLKKNYMGVLRIDYFDNKVRLELESLASLIYNRLNLGR